MLFTDRIKGNGEVANIKGDRSATRFTVTLNERFKNNAGEEQKRSAFMRRAYRMNSPIAAFLTRAYVVKVNGWMEANAWIGHEDKLQAGLICNVDRIQLFGKPLGQTRTYKVR